MRSTPSARERWTIGSDLCPAEFVSFELSRFSVALRVRIMKTVTRTPRTPTTHRLLLTTVVAVATGHVGCVADGDDAPDLASASAAVSSTTGGDPKGPTVDYPATTVSDVTVKGVELFDDWRHYGRLNLRYDRNGVAGKDKSKLGTTGGNCRHGERHRDEARGR